MNPYLSKKIKVISFISIICVVFIHAYNYTDLFLQPNTKIAEGLQCTTFIEFLISNALTRFAVPAFFMISGYLYFLNYENTVSSYFSKLKKRFCSLFIPYIIWTAFVTVIFILLANTYGIERFLIVAQKLTPIIKNGPINWLFESPAFQFWFILDLMKLVIIAPIIYLLAKHLKLVFIIILGILWIQGLSLPINIEGLLFFSVGAYVAIHKVSLPGTSEDNRVPKAKAYFVCILWIISCTSYTLLSSLGIKYGISDIILIAFYKINVLLGLAAIWTIYDCTLSDKFNSDFKKSIISSTFMIFALHEPMQHLIDQVLLEINSSNLMHIGVYICVPIILSILCVMFNILLKKIFPPIQKVLTGGR